MNKCVVVAMSGGVDSSVAALLLKKKGYQVIGVTMCFDIVGADSKKPLCCGVKAIEDARRVSRLLGIRHYLLNFKSILQEKVIKNFFQEYAKGRTPNPCIRCNQFVKFDALLKRVRNLGADFLATGHYAEIKKTPSGFLLKKAKDKTKDQSYFLYLLNQQQLKYVLFPLAEYTKQEVRKIARRNNLPVAEKRGSQEICFLSGRDYRDFIKAENAAKAKPGPIIDKSGNILGKHRGIALYTVGQREGLGIAKGYPLYITKIDAKRKRIIVGRKEDIFTREFLVLQPHFILRSLKNRVVAKVKIRYNHKEAQAEIIPFKKGFKVIFERPQPAITPGQSAVFYDKDTIIGGGIIEIP